MMTSAPCSSEKGTKPDGNKPPFFILFLCFVLSSDSSPSKGPFHYSFCQYLWLGLIHLQKKKKDEEEERKKEIQRKKKPEMVAFELETLLVIIHWNNTASSMMVK